MKLDLSLDARNWLAQRGYDPVYGARPLKRVIQKELQDPLARLLLEGKILDGETIHVGVEHGALSINGVPNHFAKGKSALN
jgi:ATP-dependent Clp protease ATP-binding subunit ClpB